LGATSGIGGGFSTIFFPKTTFVVDSFCYSFAVDSEEINGKTMH
jgi:hypothetical protein